jgi:hypothetical protein
MPPTPNPPAKCTAGFVGCHGFQLEAKKKMWPIALESMLGVLGLKILLIEDDAATARTLALRTPVDRANQRFGNVCRVSAKLLPRPSRIVGTKRPARRGKYG